MKLKIRTILSLVIIAAAAQAIAAQGTVRNWTIDGVKREALVFAPKPTTHDIRHPVVFAWHGHGGNMQGTSQQMHIQTVWPEAIVVYAQGLPSESPVDPNGTKPGWQTEAGQNGDRDLKLFDAMLATIKQNHSVDDARIYTTGFSNGGGFSYLLWAERGKTIAAIGEVAGRLFPAEHLTLTRPLLAIAGQADTTDPFALQQQTIEAARQVDNATGNGQGCGQVCTFYASTSQTPVKTFIHPGAHVYPPWAPAEIVKFFKNHHL
jgi:polyhydroxybutyrate depolymerase